MFLRIIEIVPTGGTVGLFAWLTILVIFIVMEIYYKFKK